MHVEDFLCFLKSYIYSYNMAAGGEVGLKAELQNNGLFQSLHGHIRDILMQADEVPRVDLYKLIEEYNKSKTNTEEIQKVAELLFPLVNQAYMNKLQARGINEQPNLQLVTRKKCDEQRKKLASDIVDMFLYYVKRSDIFPKDILTKGCKYVDIIDNHTVEQPVSGQGS